MFSVPVDFVCDWDCGAAVSVRGHVWDGSEERRGDQRDSDEELRPQARNHHQVSRRQDQTTQTHYLSYPD